MNFDLTRRWHIKLDKSLHYRSDYQANIDNSATYFPWLKEREGNALTRVYFLGYWRLSAEQQSGYDWDGTLKLNSFLITSGSSYEAINWLPSYLFPNGGNVLVKGNQQYNQQNFNILKGVKRGPKTTVNGVTLIRDQNLSYQIHVNNVDEYNGNTYEGSDVVFNYDHLFKFLIKKDRNLNFDINKVFIDVNSNIVLKL